MTSLSFLPQRRVLLALLFCAATAFLYTRHNAFPYWFHPDEPKKVRQILSGERDFRHPLLLLTASQTALQISGLPHTKSNVVVVGRWCSALFAAVAVSALAWLAYRQLGLAAMMSAGLTAMLHPQIFELSHFMKEDTALLMGLALSFVALHVFWQTRLSAHAVALGIACGLAASAKYVGVMALVIGLPFAIFADRFDRTGKQWSRAGLFLLAFAVAVLALNWQAWIRPSLWLPGFSTEMAAFHRADRGGYAPPSWSRLDGFFNLTPMVTWIFAAIYLGFFAAARNQKNAVKWVLALFPFVYGAAVLIAGKESERYFLPAAAFISYQAGLGVVELSSCVAARFAARRTVAFFLCVTACLVLVLQAHIPEFSASYAGFQTDQRRQLANFVTSAVPEDAVIAAEKATGLVAFDPDAPPPVRQRVIGAHFASDLGPIEELRAQGVTHVAVVSGNIKRFTRVRGLPAKREFYERLASEGKLLFEVKKKPVRILNPGLRLYRIAP